MRKQAKKQLYESVEYLIHTAETIGDLLGRLSREQAIDVLAQMQELVIRAGETIEATEKDCTEIIQKLEYACEVIYQMTDSLDEYHVRINLLKELKELFEAAHDEIQRNIPEKLEILFLPYQVSMWDSLESVWMAAKERGDLDCYVVPIPYYDVLPDNSLGNIHYEGDKYPDYVPVTSYLKYSIEARRPDVIFFHDPYDEFNRVTRIPEQFYSKNLKKYTDMLVYIPYFVSEEGGPAEYQCYTSGVLFADRVIVQPGSIYEKYCRIYTNVVRQNGLEHTLIPAEQKFLPLGSPKFDKVLNMKCEPEDLPEAWQDVIRKPDGSRKKIILYNLSISPMLENREQTLNKLDNVFQFFRERREELVMLWRPHPLLLKTIESMVPWLRDAYMQRVQQFQKEGWGIFDETPDPNLAMVVSDGYYGDMSSLVTTYRETGKPILLQDYFVEEIAKAELRTIYALAGECIENKIYLYNIYNNSICKIDKTTGNIEVEYGDDKRPYYEAYLYFKSVIYKQTICFISDKEENVLKYDTITGKKEWIYFKGNGIELEPALCESMLFLMPVGYSEQLICINLIDNNVEYIPTNYSVQLNRTLQVEQYIYGKTLRLGDWIYRGSCLEACIQKFNIKTGVFEYIVVKHFKRPIRAISFDGEYFWILSQTDGMMICWDEKRNNIMTSIDLSHESGKKEMTYATCFYANGIVYIPEKNGTCILELDVKESLLVSYECKDIPGFKMNGQGNQAFGEHIRIGDDGAVYFFPLRANGVVVKTKAGCVHFYKSETVNGLGIAADQQIQNENTCTLNHFYKKLELENKRIIYESNVGLNIVRDICKTS